MVPIANSVPRTHSEALFDVPKILALGVPLTSPSFLSGRDVIENGVLEVGAQNVQ